MLLRRQDLICLQLLLASVVPALSWTHRTEKDFFSTIEANEVVLAAFVLPNTAATDSLEPEWMSASAKDQAKLVSIDCSVETELCARNEVVSYPAIRLFRGKDKIERYRGPRKSHDILAFTRRAKLPELSTLDEKNITAFKSIDDIVFIAYLTPSDTDIKTSFAAIASHHYREFTFAIAPGVNLARIEGAPLASIVCYNNPSSEIKVYTEDFGTKSLGAFIELCTTPLIGSMTRRNEVKYLQSGKSLIYVFAATEAERDAYRSMLVPLAKQYQEYILFLTIDVGQYGYMASALGLEEGVFPALALQNPKMGMVFAFEGRDITLEGVEAFVLEISKGERSPSQSTRAMGHDEL